MDRSPEEIVQNKRESKSEPYTRVGELNSFALLTTGKIIKALKVFGYDWEIWLSPTSECR